jgi:hypothetical protein
MIVEPGFLHHWKTLRLIELTGEAGAPLMILRLWSYCHSARMWKFRDMADEKLAGICGWKGDPQEFRSTMIKCGFLELQGPFLTVHEWDKYNRKLISCWRNGKKGGRYCKTQPEPTANPIEPKPTHANPSSLVLSSLNLSVLKESVQYKFREWVQVRVLHKNKPKVWERMFREQINWLQQYTEEDQVEILSASIRGNWQGLFAPKESKHQDTKPLTDSTDDGYWVKPTWNTK